MHVVYKLIALSVVFGLVVTAPTYEEDVSTEFMDYVANVTRNTNVDKGRTVDIELLVPELKWLPILIKLLPSILAIKTKIVKFVAIIIKWLAPKTILLAIGSIATFAFCKISNLCSVAYEPAVYDYVPPQYRDFVTPEKLEDAQQYLMSALQQYERR